MAETTSPSALEAVDQTFHEAYATGRRHASRMPPVVVVLADVLVLVSDERQHNVPLSPPGYHVVKAVAHAPLGAFLVARGRGDETDEARLTALEERLAGTRRELAEVALDDDARHDLERICDLTRAFVADVRANGTDEAACRAFARAMGPRLLDATEHAVALQLAALEERTDELLALVPPDRLGEVEVVVAGAHQARERSLGMQYFRARIGEDADLRVTYAENVSDIDAALALVGTRKFDRVIAQAFFDDPEKLERDILGDAVEKALSASSVRPLEASRRDDRQPSSPKANRDERG